MNDRARGFVLEEPVVTFTHGDPVEVRPGYIEHPVQVNDPLTIRQRASRFLTRMEQMDYAEIGYHVAGFFIEASHGCWDSVSWRSIRAYYHLMADMDCAIGATQPITETHQLKPESAAAWMKGYNAGWQSCYNHPNMMEKPNQDLEGRTDPRRDEDADIAFVDEYVQEYASLHGDMGDPTRDAEWQALQHLDAIRCAIDPDKLREMKIMVEKDEAIYRQQAGDGRPEQEEA